MVRSHVHSNIWAGDPPPPSLTQHQTGKQGTRMPSGGRGACVCRRPCQTRLVLMACVRCGDQQHVHMAPFVCAVLKRPVAYFLGPRPQPWLQTNTGPVSPSRWGWWICVWLNMLYVCGRESRWWKDVSNALAHTLHILKWYQLASAVSVCGKQRMQNIHLLVYQCQKSCRRGPVGSLGPFLERIRSLICCRTLHHHGNRSNGDREVIWTGVRGELHHALRTQNISNIILHPHMLYYQLDLLCIYDLEKHSPVFIGGILHCYYSSLGDILGVCAWTTACDILTSDVKTNNNKKTRHDS